MQRIIPTFMFTGNAEAALQFYVSLFPDATIDRMVHYGPGEQCPEGCVKMALFSLLGSQYRCMDSPAVHDFSFTPAISLLAQCDAVEEVDRLFKALSLGGQVLMPLQAYPFSERYAWVNDRFGVSWQLYLIPTAR